MFYKNSELVLWFICLMEYYIAIKMMNVQTIQVHEKQYIVRKVTHSVMI